MTFSVSQLEILRRKGQYQQVYLAVENPLTVWTGRVSGSPNAGSISIPFSNENIVSTPVANYTLLVGTALGSSDRGIVRFRSKSGSDLAVGFNHIDWHNGDYLTIVRQVRPWALFPSVDGSKEDQDLTYSAQNTTLDPIARIGSSVACAFRDGDGLARVKFYSNSQAMSGSLSSHAWTFEGGTPATSTSAGSSGSPIEVTFSTVGQHWVTYTVTDSNGNTAKRYCTVFIFNRDGVGAPLVQDSTSYGLSSFEVSNLAGNYEDGGWSFEFNSYLSDSDWLEGSQVVLFADQYWNGEQTNIGLNWSYRENILFSGWLKSMRTAKTTDKFSTAFSCYGPVGWLKEAEAWPSNLAHNTSGWHGLGASMTPDKAALHLLREHSTIDLVCDINLTGDTASLLYVDCAEDRLYNQVNNQVYTSIAARLLSDRLGRLVAEKNQQLIPVASRTAETLMSITSDDWRDEISLGDEFDYTQVSQIDFAGFYYSGSDPKKYYSLAPGRELSTGSMEQVTGVRSDSQSDTNILAGLYLAWRNNQFQDVKIPSAGFMPVDIVPQQRVALTLTDTDTGRGLVWSEKGFWVRSVTHDFSKGSGLTDLGIEAESDGPPGVTNIVPDDVPPAYPDYTDSFEVPTIDVITPPVSDVVQGDGNTVYVVTATKVGRSRNFTVASPNYEDITGLATGTFTNFILDPWNPVNVGYLLTTTKLYKTSDLNSDFPTWTVVLDATISVAQTGGSSINYLQWLQANITADGLIFVCGTNATDFVQLWHSHDGGTTWSRVQVSDSNALGAFPMAVGQWDALNIWIVGGAFNATYFRHSSDGGHSFSALSLNGGYGDIAIHVPYSGNETYSKVYVGGGRESTTDAYFGYRNGSTGVFTDIAPTIAHAWADGVGDEAYRHFAIHAYTQDGDKIALLGTNSKDKRGSEYPHFYFSPDAGATWQLRKTFSGAVDTIGGWPYGVDQFYALGSGADFYIGFSSDGGYTWSEKYGDWVTVFGGNPSGRSMIVPVWVAT